MKTKEEILTESKIYYGQKKFDTMVTMTCASRAMDEYASQEVERAASAPVIKAKAIRKKGTNEWYYLSYNDSYERWQWYHSKRFEIIDSQIYNIYKKELLSDAELVDIEIRVIEPKS